MKILSLENQKKFCYTISPFNQPTLYLIPGESAVIETEDAASGQVRGPEDVRDRAKMPRANPQSGPIFIQDAEPGDTLAVDIIDILPLIGQGASWFNSWWWYLGSMPSVEAMSSFVGTTLPSKTRVYPIQGDKILFSEKIALPYRPMIGTIGTAPADEAITSSLPGPHGGNMDLPDLTIGSKILLPVRVRGALLHVGDVHAIQGDCEISGTAIEMPSSITMTVGLIKGQSIRWPRIETEGFIGIIACSGVGRNLEDAIRLAFVELIDWLEKDYAFDRFDALQLCTFLAKVQLGSIWTVAVKFPKKYLTHRGV